MFWCNIVLIVEQVDEPLGKVQYIISKRKIRFRDFEGDSNFHFDSSMQQPLSFNFLKTSMVSMPVHRLNFVECALYEFD